MAWPRDERSFIFIAATTRLALPRKSAPIACAAVVTCSRDRPSTNSPRSAVSRRMRFLRPVNRSLTAPLYTSRYVHCTIQLEPWGLSSMASKSCVQARGPQPCSDRSDVSNRSSTCCGPNMVYVLPLPVCPYAMSVTL
eukprot:5973261-Prymnesium_polylepis.2